LNVLPVVVYLKPMIQNISIGSAREKQQNGGSVNVLIVVSSPTSQYQQGGQCGARMDGEQDD